MKPIFVLLLSVVIAHPAYAQKIDKDGVPIVDIHGKIVPSTDAKAIAFAKEWGFQPPRARMIDVDGKLISLQEFLLAYCQGKPQNDTCSRGSKIQSIDSSRGPVETLPKGL